MQNLYRLANVMGLDTTNAQHTVALKEAMYTIADQDKFIDYCRSQKDGIEYASKVEKLDTLATRYKKTINDIPTQLLQKFCYGIVVKIKLAIQILRDNEEYLDNNLSKLIVDEKQYFTDKEIDLINSTGKLNRIIWLYEMHTLSDALYENSVQKVILSKQNTMLSNVEKNVLGMIGGAL